MVQTAPNGARDQKGARRFCSAAFCPACPLANQGKNIFHRNNLFKK
jgi:hypothetical protein